MIYLRLFYEFFMTGLLAFGGGLATVPFLRDVSERTGWFTLERLADMIAVAESTPGPIGVNMATYTGFTVAGIPGAVAAVLGLATPSVAVILIVARLLARFRDSPSVSGALYGLLPASLALIASAGFEVVRISLWSPAAELTVWQRVDWKGVALAAVLIPVMHRRRPDPILLIAISAIIGIIFKF
jgi:chromate transporter